MTARRARRVAIIPAMPSRNNPSAAEKKLLGWREWVALPDLGIDAIKAKVDTGARTSSLHAIDVEPFVRGKREMVRFKVHPEQRSNKRTVEAEAPVCDWRFVKSSSGQSEKRPVILTSLAIHGETWEAELTLTRRDEMGFRMLLGRQATRRRFVIDPGASYVSGKRARRTKRLKHSKPSPKKSPPKS